MLFLSTPTTPIPLPPRPSLVKVDNMIEFLIKNFNMQVVPDDIRAVQ